MGCIVGLLTRVSLWPAVLPSDGTACHSHTGSFPLVMKKKRAEEQFLVDPLKAASFRF